ncbi:MAG: hypothetical protein HLX51_11765 [Micrococcaceae bacterium]|nr:hypothetical protein [Micrococcaceae bacterium]
MSVYEATEKAVKAADHITDEDAGAVATLLHVAQQIDAQTNGLTPDGKLDNVSVPTYLKYCDALGLTPVSRVRWFEGAKKEGSGGKLGQLRGIAGGKTA